jgi:hypothetical protein
MAMIATALDDRLAAVAVSERRLADELRDRWTSAVAGKRASWQVSGRRGR